VAFVHNAPNLWFSYSKVEKRGAKSFNTKSLFPVQPGLHLKILCSAHSLQLRFLCFSERTAIIFPVQLELT
jgi:hypothetical protein